MSDDTPDAGLISYATLLAVHDVAVDPARLRHELGHHRPPTSSELLRLAKRQADVRVKSIRANWDRLRHIPLPALAYGPEGWFLIGSVSGNVALIQRPGERSSSVNQQILERIWSGELLLITERAGAVRLFFSWLRTRLNVGRPDPANS